VARPEHRLLACLVARAGAREDWLALFEKSGGVAAHEWPNGLVRLYNRRLAASRDVTGSKRRSEAPG
jgi:hypothetical protein